VGNNAGTRWLAYCRADGPTSAFSTTEVSITLKLTTTLSGEGQIVHPVGGSTHAVSGNSLTFAATPFWWHAKLRSETILTKTEWPLSSETPSYDVFMTAPTHPVYAGQDFWINVYNYASYGEQEASSFTFALTFDAAVVEYVGSNQNRNFGGMDVGAPAPNQRVFKCGGESASSSAVLSGFFWYFSVRFRFKSTVGVSSDPTTGTATGIKIEKQGIATGANLGIGAAAGYMSIYDFRAAEGGNDGADSVHMVVEAPTNRAVSAAAFQLARLPPPKPWPTTDEGNGVLLRGAFWNPRARRSSSTRTPGRRATTWASFSTIASSAAWSSTIGSRPPSWTTMRGGRTRRWLPTSSRVRSPPRPARPTT
jgi:hypothetical protein